jgi:hypothetical protein
MKNKISDDIEKDYKKMKIGGPVAKLQLIHEP